MWYTAMAVQYRTWSYIFIFINFFLLGTLYFIYFIIIFYYLKFIMRSYLYLLYYNIFIIYIIIITHVCTVPYVCSIHMYVMYECMNVVSCMYMYVHVCMMFRKS